MTGIADDKINMVKKKMKLAMKKSRKHDVK